MRKIITIMLMLAAAAALGQGNQIDYRKAIIRNWIIYQGDTLTIADVRGDTVIFTKGANIDTIYSGSNVWLDGTNNVYLATTTDTVKASLIKLPEATASTGIIYKGASPWLHDFKGTGTTGYNVFLGGAGNLTLTGSDAGDEGSFNIMIGRNVAPNLTTGYGNLVLGYYAGQNLSTGSYNVGLGPFAMQAVTTAVQNTAVGFYALRANTATGNTAVGASALAANITGTSNTAVGTGALSKALTGDPIDLGNTAMGAGALENAVYVYGCTAIGNSALGSTDSAVTNTAVGQLALFKSKRACNVAVGNSALMSAVYGMDNVGIGTGALMNLTSTATFKGMENIGIGTYVGDSIADGIGNVLIGQYAMRRGRDVNYNIGLGYYAGYNNLDGDNNIFIGKEAGKNSNQSNKLWIENSDVDSSNALIFGNFVTNKVALSGYLELKPTTSSLLGVISKNKAPWLHDFSATGTTGKNIFLGFSTGNFTLTGSDAGDEGSFNILTGYNVGTLLTTGKGNVISGYYSGQNLSSGNYNMGIGAFALQAVTTGEYNVAMGYAALKNNTGTANIGVGASTLYSNTEGIYNTAIGYEALYSNKAASGNTAIGYNALYYAWDYASATSTYNTAVGVNAMRGSSTAANNGGIFNTAMGYNTMLNMTTADYTTAIGQGAGGLLTSGDNNTYLGRQAGYSNQTGSGNVALGYMAGYSETGDNTLYVSNSNTATPLIKGVFPNTSLTVNGAVVNPMGTFADNDTSPTVAGNNVWKYNGTANSVSIVSFDDHVVGAFYTIIGNSGTYTITIVDGTPAGGDSFNLAGANWVGGRDDVLLLYCYAADNFIEISRSDN